MELDHISVLLIEDNPLHTRLLQGLLEQTPLRCQIDAMRNLQEGLRAANAQAYDLVLLDLVLPDARGLESLFRWKAEAPPMPVIILTGLNDMALATQAVESGAEDYLLKSQITPTLLNRALRNALERWHLRQREWDVPAFQRLQTRITRAADLLDFSEGLRRALLLPFKATYATHPRETAQGQLYTLCSYQVRHLPGPCLGTLELGSPRGLGEITARAIATSLQSALFQQPFIGAAVAIWAEGIDLEPHHLQEHLSLIWNPDHGSLTPFSSSPPLSSSRRDQLLDVCHQIHPSTRELPADQILWLPPDAPHFGPDDAAQTDARLIIEASPNTILPEADLILLERDILVLPDLIATSILDLPAPTSLPDLLRPILTLAQTWQTDLRTAAIARALLRLRQHLEASAHQGV